MTFISASWFSGSWISGRSCHCDLTGWQGFGSFTPSLHQPREAILPSPHRASSPGRPSAPVLLCHTASLDSLSYLHGFYQDLQAGDSQTQLPSPVCTPNFPTAYRILPPECLKRSSTITKWNLPSPQFLPWSVPSFSQVQQLSNPCLWEPQRSHGPSCCSSPWNPSCWVQIQYERLG